MSTALVTPTSLDQLEQFWADLVSAYGVTKERLHVEMGAPRDCLTQTVAEYGTDMIVMGASSHGRWHRMVVGSTASTLLESIPCDILIVRPFDDVQAVPC